MNSVIESDKYQIFVSVLITSKMRIEQNDVFVVQMNKWTFSALHSPLVLALRFWFVERILC